MESPGPRGLSCPGSPSGVEGVDLFVASSAAAIGVMDWVLFQYAGLARGWGRKHETLARVDIVFGLFLPFVLINFIVMAVFAGTLHKVGITPETAPELAASLAPLLGPTWSSVLFYIAFLAVPISTTVGHGASPEPSPSTKPWDGHRTHGHGGGRSAPSSPTSVSWLCGIPRPIWLVIAIAAFLSLATNIVGWSFYLLLNDRRLLGEDRSKSYLWNLGIMLQITLLNCVAIVYVLNRIGWWIR